MSQQNNCDIHNEGTRQQAHAELLQRRRRGTVNSLRRRRVDLPAARLRLRRMRLLQSGSARPSRAHEAHGAGTRATKADKALWAM